MYFLYRKDNGEISPPIKKGKPDQRSLDKEINCGIGSGVKWENVNLFYAPDEEFPKDFFETASLGKYRIENEEIEEDRKWEANED